MKEHFCSAEKSMISYEGECNWCDEREKSMTDSPCIAVCTTLYDEVCKGCGRTYVEVAQWNGMTDEEKQDIWIRIDTEATAWRYNIYKNRVKT